MYSKNNYKMNEKKQAEKIVRYGIRKLKLGVTLVAVSAGLFFVGNSAQAAETTDNNTVTEEQPQSSGVDKDSEGAAETTATEGETATADNKESVVEGKDISNNMQTTIALTHDNNPVVVDAGHSLSAKVTFAIEKVKAGDYFTVKFSDEVDLAGIARPKEFETNLWIEDSIKLADGKYDPTTNSVKYVVTKEAEVLRNINASKSYYVAINRDKVTETKTITPTISVGNNKETFSVPVKYEAVDRAKTEKAVNGLATSSLITEENEAANKVTSVTYANINREKVSNTTYTERNSNGKNIAQYNSTDTEVKIYKVPKGVALNSSYSYDPTKLEDVTEKYELKYEDNTLNIDFKNIEDAYIIVTTNTTKPEEGQADSEMQVSSSMSGKTENNRYINSTSTTARGITVAGGSDSGSASEDLPYALGNLVWEDKNNNGIQDEDEKGIPNVKVTLVDSKGVERTTTTNEDGQYYFSKVYNGAYTVRFDVPEGYRPTKVNEGTDKEKDSNGTETTVTIQNASDWSIDSGFYKPVGSVDVRYVIKDTDTEIKETQSVVKEELVDSPYSSDTDEYKPKEITKDGKTYRLVGHKGSSDPENGKVTEDKKTVVYEYELVKGNVDVKYITEDGEVLEETASVKKDSPIGEEYQTEQKVFEGYEFVKLEENSAPVSGKVEEQDQHVV
ncbi:SdrD B-like domain-containing protein, partial [Gemella cuniculi]|uniref:SdrD B-like domain-containing protein n=1 Tax=Gemella cuniculi TaxID=150240 RepID=UPI0005578340